MPLTCGDTEREFQQARFYAAEKAVEPWSRRLDRDEARVMVENILTHDPPGEVPDDHEVRFDARLKRASGLVANARLIVLHPHRLTAALVVHEVAHLLTPGDGHGRRYAGVFAALVRDNLGFHAYGALLSSYDAYGISFVLPRDHDHRGDRTST